MAYLRVSLAAVPLSIVPQTPLESIIPSASAEGLQLMKDLLQWDPNRRPTARNILTHPFFTVRLCYQGV